MGYGSVQFILDGRFRGVEGIENNSKLRFVLGRDGEGAHQQNRKSLAGVARSGFWRSAGQYAARCNSGIMARLVDLVPDQPDVFCFADGWGGRNCNPGPLAGNHGSLSPAF